MNVQTQGFALTQHRPPLPSLQAASPTFGYVNLRFDPDGSVRRVAPFLNAGGATLKSFAVATAERFRRRELLQPTANGLRAPAHGGRRVPAEADGTLLINFAGPPDTFTTVPYTRVLDGRVTSDAFKDKIVLVGAAVESGDAFFTPFYSKLLPETRKLMPGVEVHANVIDMVLRGQYLTRAGWPFDSRPLAWPGGSRGRADRLGPPLARPRRARGRPRIAARGRLRVLRPARRLAGGRRAPDQRFRHLGRHRLLRPDHRGPGEALRPLGAGRLRGARRHQGGHRAAHRSGPGRQAADAHDPLLRHPRLHRHVRARRPRGDGGSARRALRRHERYRAPPPRHARQVHRRRGHGLLGGAHAQHGPRRRAARRAGRHRDAGRRPDPGRDPSSSASASPSRSASASTPAMRSWATSARPSGSPTRRSATP